MTEQENQNRIKILNELDALVSNICNEEHPCRRRRCQDCKLDYISDYILRREEEVRKEERKETAGTILSAWKQISRSYDIGETQKKSFERIDRLSEWYGAEVEE